VRSLPDTLDLRVVAEIDARLSSLEMEGARILLAVESGSRAWGFPSPDSDYDTRFIYSRRLEDYLRLFPLRDVIETPLDEIFDVNGWDLAKALRLLVKGNAIIVEWLMSPVVYRGDAEFHADMLNLARHAARREQMARHYLHLGLQQRQTYFADGRSVKVKKLFYALRPAIALRWMAAHPHETLPPMHFPTLMAQSGPPANIAAIVARMLDEKARTREMGSGQPPDGLLRFIDEEFERARERWCDDSPLQPTVIEAADALFRKWASRP
jgi:predicted nucleotidyltransferase